MKKNRKYLIALLACVALAGVASAADLDGRTYEVEMTGPDGNPYTDTLIFEAGTFDSVECRPYGFDATAYEVEKGDGLAFSASAKSKTDGVAVWNGSVDGDSISGTMKWSKPGEEPTTYEFHGKLKS